MTTAGDKALIRVAVESRLPTRPFPPQVLEVPSGTRLGELLKLLELGDMEEELIMVADGASACRSDRLEKSGTLLLLPVICGG